MLRKTEQRSGSFTTGLIMTVVAGICSCGMSLSFVYGQGPIVAAMKAQGAGDLPATFAVWAVGLLGGSAINIIYPAYLLTKKKSWGVLATSWRQVMLACIIGANMAISIVLMGSGMLLVGALGASVGFGIQQASQMFGNQGLGFISGEWKGVLRQTAQADVPGHRGADRGGAHHGLRQHAREDIAHETNETRIHP